MAVQAVAARAGAQKMGFIESDVPESLFDQYFNPEANAAEIATAANLLVLEDDPYGLVRYEGEPEPSLLSGARGVPEWHPRSDDPLQRESCTRCMPG